MRKNLSQKPAHESPRDVGGGVDRSARARGAVDPQASFLELQRTAGNEVASDVIRQTVIPGPITLSRPGDRSEHEADRLSESIVPGTGETAEAKSPDISQTAAQQTEGHDAPSSPQARADLGLGMGREIPEETRLPLERALGTDLSSVRVHTDPDAQSVSAALNARAFTAGGDIGFGKDQYHPETREGQKLLAHELTHVAQQTGARNISAKTSPTTGAATHVQGSFLDDVWGGIESVGGAVGGALESAGSWLADRVRDVGEVVSSAANWVGERVRDASMWVVNLIRDLPGRLARLASTLWDGLSGIVTFIPEAIQALASGGLSGFAKWLWKKARRGGAWVLTLLSRVFDVLGGPEIAEFIWHLVTNARPLSGDEIAAGSSVLGPNAIRWGDVRVSTGGLLRLVFALNEGRAFVTFHTINLPEGESIDTVVHELTHVYQYEQVGTLYLGQAIHAQATGGGNAYNYGGYSGLVADKAAGKQFSEYNREQQAQIAQDYYTAVVLGEMSLTDEQRAAFDHYIGQLRAGQI